MARTSPDIPVIWSASRITAASPITTGLQVSPIVESARDLVIISGPDPVASPMVTAKIGLYSVFKKEVLQSEWEFICKPGRLSHAVAVQQIHVQLITNARPVGYSHKTILFQNKARFKHFRA